MTGPYVGGAYDNSLGSQSPIAKLEFEQFMDRRKQLMDEILNAAHAQTMMQQTAQQGPVQAAQRGPVPMLQQDQSFLESFFKMPDFGGSDAGPRPKRPAGQDELIAQARFWNIPNPEQIDPGQLQQMIQQRRLEMPRDEQTSAGSASLAFLGAASEAGTATSRLIGNIFGDVEKLPFAGPALSRILHSEEAKRWMYDLSQKTSEFTEATRAAQPLQDAGAFNVLTASGSVGGYALPALLAWNGIGAAAGYVPEAWAARVASPIARAALQGGLTGTVLEAGSDESAQSKVFNIGMGMAFGAATALPRFGAALGLGAVGAGIGGQVGDTPEERTRHAIEGGLAGLALGVAPLAIGAAAKVRADFKSPFDAAVEDAVRLNPGGGRPPQQGNARVVGEPALPSGPEYSIAEPALLVRTDPVTSEPIIMEGMSQHTLAQPEQKLLPRFQASESAGPLAGTKVAGPDGAPLTVYHGTGVDFEAIDPNKLDPQALFGPGFYATESPAIASGYAGNVSLPDMYTQFPAEARYPNIRPLRLNIQNPFDIDAPTSSTEALAIVDKLEKILPGYDWSTPRKILASGDWNSMRIAGPGFQHNNEDLYNVLSRTFLSENVQGPFTPDLTSLRPLDGYELGKAGLNNALQQIGYDGITHIGGARTGNDPHRVWIAFNPSQVHSPWDVPDLSIEHAAASADAMTKQATVMESSTLPEAMGKVVMDDSDVVKAAQASNPGGVSVVRGVLTPMRVIQEAGPGVTFVQRPNGWDALVGDVTPQQVKEFTDYGVFTGQKVVTANTGLEGEITGFSKGMVMLKRPDGPPLRIRPENVLPSRYGVPVQKAPELWDAFKQDLLSYMNYEAAGAGMSPVLDMNDSRVPGMLAERMNDFLSRKGITDPAVRQAIDADFNHRWVQDLRELDYETKNLQDELLAAGVDAANETESSDSHHIVQSLEEAAEKRGFIWISRPEQGGVLKDTINAGAPDIPLVTDEAAHEFLVRTDRTLPDYTPASDVPLEVANMVPGDLGHEPRLSTEDYADNLRATIDRAHAEDVAEVEGAIKSGLSVSSGGAGGDVAKWWNGLTPEQRANRLGPSVTGRYDSLTSALQDELNHQYDYHQNRSTFTPNAPDIMSVMMDRSESLDLGGGGGGYIPPSGPPSIGGGFSGGRLPGGRGETLPEQFARMRRSDPSKIHAMEEKFKGLLDSHLRYTRYAMLNMERMLTEGGVDLGRAWKHYDELAVAHDQAAKEGAAWLNEWGDIMREFPRKILRDGTVTRIHEIQDTNERMQAWDALRRISRYQLSEERVAQAIKADERITDFNHRFFTNLVGDPAFALTMDREIFRYMSHVRARQSQGISDPYNVPNLNPNVQFFAEYAREGNLQFRVMDARELGNHMVRAAMFKKYEAEPWKNLVEAWDDDRVPAPLRQYMMDYARLSRFGYDPKGELAVRGIQSVMNKVFKTPVTMREAQHLLNVPSGAMYLSMLAGRASIFFRDAIQPLISIAKVEVPYIASTYANVLKGAGQRLTRQDENVLREMYHRGLDGGWIQQENPNLEAAGFFEEQPNLRENELLHLTPEQAKRRELLASIGDRTADLPAWLVRPSESRLSTLKWYAKEGQLNRLIVGESAYNQAKAYLDAFRKSTVEAVLSRDPSKEMSYDQFAEKSFFSSFEPPIQQKLKELVQAGDDEGAAQLFAREVANWSQFKYGRKEVPDALRGNIGRYMSMFGSWTGQFLEGINSALANGSTRHKARFAMTVGTVSSAMFLLKNETGWSFDKWAWVPNAFQYAGSPFLEMAARGVAAASGAVNLSQNRPASDFEKSAMKEEITTPILSTALDFLPWTGYIRSAQEYSNAFHGTNPLEQAARYTITGDRGGAVDFRRIVDEMTRREGHVPEGALSPNGGLMPGRPGSGYGYPQGGYGYPRRNPGAGAMP